MNALHDLRLYTEVLHEWCARLHVTLTGNGLCI